MQLAIRNEDKEKVLSLVTTRKTNLPVGASSKAVFLRVYSYIAYQDILDAVTAHGEYIDPKGEMASSLKGLVMQINKKIKAVFGKAVNDLSTEDELECLAVMRSQVTKTLVRGEIEKELRKNIKRKIYEIIPGIYSIMMPSK